MTDKNESSSSSSKNGNQGTGSSGSSDSGRQIPSTNPGQRSTIEKGGNPTGTPLKQK